MTIGRPPKTTHDEQWEIFADCMARGATQSNAVRAAGYTTRQPYQTGNMLLKRPEIQARIAELKEFYRANPPPEDPLPEPSLDWVTTSYVKAVKMSEDAGDRSSMIKGLDSIAKLKGYMVERTESRTGPLDGLSAQQLQMMVEFAERAQKRLTNGSGAVVEAEVLPAEEDDD